MSAYEQFVDEIVTVTSGPHKGKTGYCDDVSNEDREAYVYFGSYMDGDTVINTRRLAKATEQDGAAYAGEFMSSPERWYSKTA